jgi:ABC-type bacteriocin/lantibiotic exporter with double-glycine peptidase domain
VSVRKPHFSRHDINDANNERIIMDNLREFYHGKTIVIVAHRLSSVQHANNIIVLDKDKILEEYQNSRRGTNQTVVILNFINKLVSG